MSTASTMRNGTDFTDPETIWRVEQDLASATQQFGEVDTDSIDNYRTAERSCSICGFIIEDYRDVDFLQDREED